MYMKQLLKGAENLGLMLPMLNLLEQFLCA